MNAGAAPTGVGPGAKIAGYRLEEQIGQGGMAVVYRAFDERLERRVALKLLAPSLASDTAFRSRFIRESRAAAAVDHPNIIPVYDAGDAGGFLFISMRFVQGGDVRTLLADGPLAPARVWNIVTQVASALDAAHAHNLVHRDVKPGNMLLDARRGAADGERDHVYLSDFGISRQTVASHLTSTGQFVGTLDYIAPEQIEAQEVDGRADQYSLACAAFELLGGGPPFQKDQALGLISAHLSEQPPSLVSRRPGLPKAVDLVLAKAMAKEPADRYGSCADFAADLGRALGLAPGQLIAAAAAGGARQATELAMPPAGPEPQPEPTRLAGEPAVPAAAAVAAMEATVSTNPPAAHGAPTVNPPGSGTAPLQPAQPQWPAGQPPPQQQWPAAQPPPQQQWPAAQPQPQYPGYQPPGPTAPGAGWPTPPQPKKRSRGLLIGVVVAVVAVAGAAVAVALALGSKNSGTGNPNAVGSSSPAGHSSSPANLARPQATALNHLLITSMNSRPAWDNLVNDVAQCSNLGYDITQIGNIRSARASELTSAGALQVSALPNGTSLKAELMHALRLSLRIDDNYLSWAHQQQDTSCSAGTSSGYYQAASNADPHATSVKNQFLSLWNPVASTYGFPNLTAGQL